MYGIAIFELILRFVGTPNTDPGLTWIGLTRGQIPADCWGDYLTEFCCSYRWSLTRLPPIGIKI